MTWLSLAEACERADGPSRELENMLFDAGIAPSNRFPAESWLTTDLNAIVALIGEKLPGWAWKFGRPLPGQGKPWAQVWDDKRKEWLTTANAATPALALCAGFCRAMAGAEASLEKKP